MPVSLSIKDVPEEVRWRLRSRALCNHRSLQNELPAIGEPCLDGASLWCARDACRPPRCCDTRWSEVVGLARETGLSAYDRVSAAGAPPWSTSRHTTQCPWKASV